MIMMMDSNLPPPTSTQSSDETTRQLASSVIVPSVNHLVSPPPSSSSTVTSAIHVDTDEEDTDLITATASHRMSASYPSTSSAPPPPHPSYISPSEMTSTDEAPPPQPSPPSTTSTSTNDQRIDPQTLEKLAKIFSCFSGGTGGEEQQNPQLMAAAAAMAVTQEQLLASMTPALMNMIHLNTNSNSGDSQSSSVDEDNSPRSKKRRKQSKPVRYESHHLPPIDDDKSSSSETHLPLLKMSSSESKEKEKERQQQHQEAAVSDEESTVAAATRSSGENGAARHHYHHHRGHRNFDEDEEVDGDNRVSGDEENESTEEVIVREKRQQQQQQQLLLQQTMENMFANLQQKLIQSYYCPQCNCAFNSEDQLRTHIEYEHMQKFFPPTSSASSNSNAPSVAAASNYELQKIVQQLAVAQQRLQEQMHKRKRKRSRSPSSGSTSSVHSSVDEDSIEQKLPTEDVEAAGDDHNKPPSLNSKSKPSSSSSSSAATVAANPKDLNHNLLALNLPPSFINPLISSLSSNTKPQGEQQQQQQQQSKISSEQAQSPANLSGPGSGTIFSNNMTPFLYPMLSQDGTPQFQPTNAMINGVPVSAVPGLRIFNPEAYCELCNKEFCNKYFLKTHKANKHGIYTSESSSVSSSGGSTFVTTAATTSGNAAFLPTSSGAIMLTSSSQSKSSSPPLFSSPQTGPLSFAAPLRFNVVNLDSYCEICQKEFCNKYFLKKHKQKIHGFVYQGDTAIPPAQSQQQSQQHLHQLQQLQLLQQQLVAQQQQQQMNGQSMSTDQANSNVPSPSQSGHLGSLIGSDAKSLNISGAATLPVADAPPTAITVTLSAEKLRQMGVMNADAFCEICCKEFCNKYFLRTHKVNKHGIVDGQTKAKDLVNQSSSSESSKTTTTMTTTSATPATSSNSATCGDDSVLEPGQRDPTTYANNGDDFLNGFASTSSNTSSGGVKCELCPQQFPNSYLLKMHKFYLHSIPYNKQQEEEDNRKENKSDLQKEEDEDTPTETSDKAAEPKEEDADSDVENEISSVPEMMVSAELNHDQSSSSTVANCQDLQKLHSMIKDLMPNLTQNLSESSDSKVNDCSDSKCVCHLCKFECDNRYFLRAHLISDHGFPPNEEALAQMLAATSDPVALKNLLELGNKLPQPFESSEAFCEICNKEFCSKYFLKTHKQNIHGIYESSTNSPLSENNSTPVPPNSAASMIPPALLNSLYQRAKTPAEIDQLNLALNQAAAMQHKFVNSTNSSNVGKFQPPPPPPPPPAPVASSANGANMASLKAAMAAGLMPPEPKPRTSSVTGRNYCNICNKELCNKYFMKTHMLKMHGINIDEHPIEAANTSTIGGVTCDICQKELCSKYFLKVHKQNTHGIYEDGSQPQVMGLGTSYQQSNKTSFTNNLLSGGSDLNPLLLMSMANQPADGNSGASDSNSVCSSNSDKVLDNKHPQQQPQAETTNDSNNRYFNTYQEVCQICDRRFKSIKWLKSHMMNDHGEVLAMIRSNNDITQAIAQATGANMEQVGRLCFVCGQLFPDRMTMNLHLVKEHKSSTEDLAMNLAGNIKMATLMAAAAAAVEQNNAAAAADLSMRLDGGDGERRSPHSLPPSPYYPSSPKDKSTEDDRPRPPSSAANPFNNPVLQSFLLKNPSLNLTLAAAAAAASTNQDNQMLPNRWLSSLFGDKFQRSESPLEMSVRAKGNKFTCHICSKSYRHAHSLQRHMLSHKQSPTPQILEPLDDVIKTALKNSAMIANEDSGSKPRNKRYRCSKCNKKFRTRELCLVHIRALHSAIKSKDIDGTRCTICGLNFDTPVLLKMHINKTHGFNQTDKKNRSFEGSDVPLNLRASDHLLPPSPSASSEEESKTGSQLPASPEQVSDTPENLSFGATDKPNSDQPMETDETLDEESNVSNSNSITHPSLICVNGEQY